MTIRVVTADKDQHISQIRELFWEYLQWANTRVNREFNVSFDIAAILEEDMWSIAKFMPPQGRLLLGYHGEYLAGMACLKMLKPRVGEVKRMYVRPSYRNAGLGRNLLNRLLQEARQIGYQSIKLDSAQFMKNAHKLYLSLGFQEIMAYEDSEIPKEFQEYWVFMELILYPQADHK